jgi:protein-S-isoprenylcysteine O-methyltransferase Ste14
MRILELRVPPVAVLLITALLMWASASAVPAVALLRLPYQALVACGFACVGAVTSILGVLSFRRAGTTVNPLKPDMSSSLVRSGIYNWTRNPMYLGFLMLLTGWGIYRQTHLLSSSSPRSFFIRIGFKSNRRSGRLRPVLGRSS